MRTILYVGSSTDLSYEHDLLEEWGKRGVTIAQASTLNADPAPGRRRCRTRIRRDEQRPSRVPSRPLRRRPP